MKSKDEYSITKDILNKIGFILNQKKEDQTVNDLIFKYQLKIFFISKDDHYEFAFDNKSHMAKIITKIVDILYSVFLMPKAQRESFYDKSIYDIKEKNFLAKLIELQGLESFDIPIKNDKHKALFKIISSALDAKENYSFSDYINSIFINLSFFPELELLLKYHLFSLITKYYLNPMKIMLDFDEKEINISDDFSLDLILELFENNQRDFDSIIKSIIILNYNSFIKSVKDYNINEILNAIKSIEMKVKKIENIGNLSLCVEKIMAMLIDELCRQKHKKMKKKKSKKKQFNEIVQKKDEKKTEEASQKNADKSIISNKEISELKKDKPNNNVIVKNDDENDIKNFKSNKKVINQFEEINKYFHNISNFLNINNIGNENIKNDVQNLQKLMINILKDNNEKLEKMRQDILNLNEENKTQKQEIQSQRQEIQLQRQEIQLQRQNISILEEKNQIQQKELNDLKESLEYIKNECQEMKEYLGNIQCKELSKNFLRVFGTLLTDDDWYNIRKNKNQKGTIIAKRIKELFPDADEQKYNLIKNLLEKSSDLIQQRNELVYNVTLEKYDEEIQVYKDKKGHKTLPSPLIFCFLVSMGISNDLFDNAYSFLIKFFDRNLKAVDGKELLDLYFK